MSSGSKDEGKGLIYAGRSLGDDACRTGTPREARCLERSKESWDGGRIWSNSFDVQVRGSSVSGMLVCRRRCYQEYELT
jgi:hypothetical protein